MKNKEGASKPYCQKFKEYFYNEIVPVDDEFLTLLENDECPENGFFHEIKLLDSTILSLKLYQKAFYKKLEYIFENIVVLDETIDFDKNVKLVIEKLKNEYGIEIDPESMEKILSWAYPSKDRTDFQTQTVYKYFVKHFKEKINESVKELLKESFLFIPNTHCVCSNEHEIKPVPLSSIKKTLTDQFEERAKERLLSQEVGGSNFKEDNKYETFDIVGLIVSYDQIYLKVKEIKKNVDKKSFNESDRKILEFYNNYSEIIKKYPSSQAAGHIIIIKFWESKQESKLTSYVKDLYRDNEQKNENAKEKRMERLLKFIQTRKKDDYIMRKVDFFSKGYNELIEADIFPGIFV